MKNWFARICTMPTDFSQQMLAMDSHATMSHHLKLISQFVSSMVQHIMRSRIWTEPEVNRKRKWKNQKRLLFKPQLFKTVFHFSSGDLVTTTFRRTPKMSTYLVAFIVSDFESTNNNSTALPMRVFTHKSYLKQTTYALSEGEKLLKAIADYVKVPYALSKMDQAAIPDFRAGGSNESIYQIPIEPTIWCDFFLLLSLHLSYGELGSCDL